MSWPGQTSDDLRQTAIVGLCRAAQTYIGDGRAKFSTYATRCIEGALLSLRARTRRIVSFGGNANMGRIRKRLRGYHGDMTSESVLAALGTLIGYQRLDESEAHRIVGYAQGTDWFFDDIHLPPGRTIDDELADDDDEATERSYAIHECSPVVARILEECASDPNPVIRAIMERRILADDPETLLAIGETYGLSRERIRQLESRFLSVVRGKLERAGLLNPESGRNV